MTLQQKLDKIELHFIVGIGRSGSTLLTTLLNQTESCISVPEIHHFIKFYHKYKSIAIVSKQVIDDYKSYIDLFFKYKNNALVGPVNYTLIDSLKIGDKITYSQLTKLVYLGLYGEKGNTDKISVLVDKNPYYTLQLKKLLLVFPEAKYIALVRDYRGFLLSNLQSKKIGTAKKSIFYYALAWNLFIKELLYYHRIYNNKVKIVKYEDLISHKETIVKEIFDFLNVPFSLSVFDFHKTMQDRLSLIQTSDKNYERMLNKISNLSKPINETRMFDWQKQLTSEQIMACDILCSTHGSKLGYTKASYYTKIDIFLVHLKSITSFIKVKVFEWMKSPELHFYYQYKIKK
ncbi:MAG: sulfotransferase [Bacteroidetes bacterium]|nr:sulfotransferase [Bacteroidota bacterium]